MTWGAMERRRRTANTMGISINAFQRTTRLRVVLVEIARRIRLRLQHPDRPLDDQAHGDNDYRPGRQPLPLQFSLSPADPQDLNHPKWNLSDDEGKQKQPSGVKVPGSRRIATCQADEAPGQTAAWAVRTRESPVGAGAWNRHSDSWYDDPFVFLNLEDSRQQQHSSRGKQQDPVHHCVRASGHFEWAGTCDNGLGGHRNRLIGEQGAGVQA